MKTWTRATAVLAGMLWAGPAQAAPPPGFEPTIETAHFRVFTRGEGGADVQKLERFLVSLEQTLGHQLAGKAQYFLYGRSEDIAAQTGEFVSGLTYADAREIHTTESFHAHEVVHLLTGQIGDPGPFFREGLAVALGDGARFQGKSVHRLAREYGRGLSLRSLVQGFAGMDPRKSYPLAGSFVAFLIQQHGVPKVKQLFESGSPDEAARFASVFGQSLEQAETDWRRTL